jgi:hypothetical protein
LRLVKTSGLYEMLRPQQKKLDIWIEQWDVDEEDQRKLYGQIADVADDAGEEESVQLTPQLWMLDLTYISQRVVQVHSQSPTNI